jgi:acyl-CoA thioesterase FadM
MSIHGRAYFKRWSNSVSISSMQELRSTTFLPSLCKPLLPVEESLSVVTLEQRLYPLEPLKQKETFEVGFRVARLSDFRFRMDIGFFNSESRKPKILAAVEQSFSDEKQRAIRIPGAVRKTLLEMYTRTPSKFNNL